ncbi:MAG: hypothetical protein JWN37_850 [Candidatus Nomurabacteria bacterium]|nr:hypothetical protein [Candidatus Nomurabacteria bacterium]
MSPRLLNTLLIVGSFALYYVVISPLYSGGGTVWQPEQSITALKTSNEEYTKTVAQVNELYNEAETLKKQYNNIDADTKKKIETMVPAKIDPVRLLSEVDNIANTTGVPISDLSYSENPAVGGRGSYTVSFSTKTTYTKFKQLLDSYEKSMRLYNIESTSFSVSTEPGTSTNYQVKLSTYYLK